MMEKKKKILMAAALLAMLAGGGAEATLSLSNNGAGTSWPDPKNLTAITSTETGNSNTDFYAATAYAAIFLGDYQSTGVTYTDSASSSGEIQTDAIKTLADLIGGSSTNTFKTNAQLVSATGSNGGLYSSNFAYTSQTSVSDAINKTYTDFTAVKKKVGNVGDISTLIREETGDTSVTQAIENLNGQIGSLSDIKEHGVKVTTAPTSAVSVVNRINDDIGSREYANGKSTLTEAQNAVSELINGTGSSTLSLSNKQTTLEDGVNRNTDIIGSTDGTLSFSNGTATLEAGINQNAALIGTLDRNGYLSLKNLATTKAEDVSLEAGINKNTEYIGGTGTDGALNLLNGATDASGMETLQAGINQNTRDIWELGDEIRAGIAKVSALAGLHPLDFTPDVKLEFAAAVGGYMSETQVALGAFYRPNADLMFSVGTTLEGHHDAFNAGLSFRSRGGGEDDLSGLYADLEALEARLSAQRAEIAALSE